MRLMELSSVYPVQKLCEIGLKQGETGDLSRIHDEDHVLSFALSRTLFLNSSGIASEYLFCSAPYKISVHRSAEMLRRYDYDAIISEIIRRTNQSHSRTGI